MSKAEYLAYLRSSRWKEIRTDRLKAANYSCALSARHRSQLEVHHRTYDRVGCENAEDLVVLCARCHRRFHDLLPAIALAPSLPFAEFDITSQLRGS